MGLVMKEAHDALPDGRVLVVDDGSTDRTAEVAGRAGATVISSPFNLGVGGAMRIGFRYAQSHGYTCLVQVDADGQHNPRDIGRLVEMLDDGPAPHVVIGPRFSGTGDFAVPRARRLAMRLLAVYLSHVTRTTLTDVTSGFRAHNRGAIELFARDYPADYLADTVESLVISTRAGGHVTQVPVAMAPVHGDAQPVQLVGDRVPASGDGHAGHQHRPPSAVQAEAGVDAARGPQPPQPAPAREGRQ